MTTEPVFPVKKNSLAITSLVLGIVAVPTINFIGVFGMLCAVGAVVCGFISLSQIKKSNESGKNLAVAGIILGFGAFVLMAFLFVVLGPIIESVFNNITQTLGQ